MSEQMTEVDAYLTEQRGALEGELCELLRLASVSADRAFAPQVRAAATWLETKFRNLGFDTRLVETPGNPLVLAEWLKAPGAPTVLIYGHYDVQPPDPLGEWQTPPFEPTRRGGNLYARGATDDKGQMFTHVASAEAWLKTAGRLPVNLKFLIEGEEEVGSAHLEPFIHRERDRLACDVVVISDTSQFAPGQPAITYGLRGIAYFELRLTGPKQDLHSGTFGGGVTNPANALAKMLASIVDDHGRIHLPGFYDQVRPLEAAERAALAALPFDEEKFRKQIGVDGLSGEAGFSTLERRWVRPTFDINGLWSGYQGEGAKTVLPARAGAKLSFRLVPDQDPDQVHKALEQHLRKHCPTGISMELLGTHGAPGVVAKLGSPWMAAAERAIEHGFGRRPVYMREGGSIPVVNIFRRELGVDTLLLGWGLDDDNAHGPNEKFSLEDFFRGMRASARLWQELAQVNK